MSDQPAAPLRRGFSVSALTRVAWGLALVGASSIVLSLALAPEGPPQPDASQSLPTAQPRGRALPSPSPGPVALPRAAPVHLTLDRVGIDADLIPLGLNADGTLEVPAAEAQGPAGWYQGLASPGEIGPAVIVGHVDAPGARAAFFNLGATRSGDRVQVVRADGTTVEFVVDLVASFPRTEFPTAAVYGPTAAPTLRLVTCGGIFIPGEGYDRSVVLFASMAPNPT